ncbi:MAG: hypothetical protein J1G38_06225 [Clostridiales bacterium]|nr:hypothetical protein [Clostridiales bacterium]
MQTFIDEVPWIISLILTVIIDPIWQGVNRILRHRGEAKETAFGVLWILTLGLFGIGWLLDIFAVAIFKTIKIFA